MDNNNDFLHLAETNKGGVHTTDALVNISKSGEEDSKYL